MKFHRSKSKTRGYVSCCVLLLSCSATIFKWCTGTRSATWKISTTSGMHWRTSVWMATPSTSAGPRRLTSACPAYPSGISFKPHRHILMQPHAHILCTYWHTRPNTHTNTHTETICLLFKYQTLYWHIINVHKHVNYESDSGDQAHTHSTAPFSYCCSDFYFRYNTHTHTLLPSPKFIPTKMHVHTHTYKYTHIYTQELCQKPNCSSTWWSDNIQRNQFIKKKQPWTTCTFLFILCTRLAEEKKYQ